MPRHRRGGLRLLTRPEPVRRPRRSSRNVHRGRGVRRGPAPRAPVDGDWRLGGDGLGCRAVGVGPAGGLVEVAADARDLAGALALNRCRRGGPRPRARHGLPQRQTATRAAATALAPQVVELGRRYAEAATVRRSAIRTRRQERKGGEPRLRTPPEGGPLGDRRGAELPSPDRNVQHCVGWLMNLKSAPGGGARTRPSTTPLPGRDRARRASRLPHRPPPVRSRTPALWRRNATFGIAGSSSAWSFLAPRDACGAQRSHLSRVPPTYRRFPCDRAKNIRDNIRDRRVGPIPTTSVMRYESHSYDDIGLLSIADDPSPRCSRRRHFHGIGSSLRLWRRLPVLAQAFEM